MSPASHSGPTLSSSWASTRRSGSASSSWAATSRARRSTPAPSSSMPTRAPNITTAEPGSDMRHTGMYFTERDEHLDLFTTDKHEAGHTTGDTVWKGALTGESRASYEGLIHIIPKAPEVDTYLQTHQMLLSPKAKGDAIPSLIVEVDNVKASHGGTVGELDPEQIFYMMTRGIPRAEAVRVLVEGYFEEVVQRLEDPGLEDLVRRRVAGKVADAEDQVKEFIGERAEAS